MDPLVSVIIPVLDGALTLDAAIYSARAQTYENLEILVVDDGSTDRTLEIAEHHANADARVRILVNKDTIGVARSRNKGIDYSNGKFIAPLDSDDIWHPDKLELQISTHEAFSRDNPDKPVVVYCWCMRMSEDGTKIPTFYRPTYSGDIFRTLASNFMPTASIPLMPRSLVVEVGGYSARLFDEGIQGCEDRDLYLSLAKYANFVCAGEILVGYRIMPNSMSSNQKTMFQSVTRVLRDQLQPVFGRKLVDRTLASLLIRYAVFRRNNRLQNLREAFRLDGAALFYWPTIVSIGGTIIRGAKRKISSLLSQQPNLIDSWLPGLGQYSTSTTKRMSSPKA